MSWEIISGTVRLRVKGGEIITPTSIEILKAEKKGLRDVGGIEVECGPSEALPDLKISRFPLRLRLVVEPPHELDDFQGRWWIDGEAGSERVESIDEHLSDGHLCSKGVWYPIEGVEREAVRAILEECGLGGDGVVSLGSYLKLIKKTEGGIVKIVQPSPKVPSKGQRLSDDEEEVSLGLKATLYPYQEAGFEWLVSVADEGLGGILGDEMGLGKTLQVIALLLRELENGRDQHLVVAPVTLLENWRREIHKFAPGIEPLVHQGRLRTGFPRELESADVVLTSYETVVRDLSLFEMIDWSVVVLDEAQAIKTPGAQRTHAVKSLRRRVGMAVTGTPVENGLKDLWSIMDFAVPGHLGTEKEFERHYVDTPDSAADLEPLITPLLLRRRVADVAQDLPERIDVPQILVLAENEASQYEELRRRTLEEYGQGAGLVSLVRVRMFCAHPFLIEGCGEGLDEGTKLRRLMEILEEVFARAEKALVFTSFNEMSDRICARISGGLGASAVPIDGRTPVEERQKLIDEFSNREDGCCLVLNPKAAGVGLNITAANHVIHYNPEWNPAVEDQATARAYRRGQERPVTVHRLIFAGTVEEVMLGRLERKRELAENAVVGGTGEELDRADILRALDFSPITNGKK